MKPRFLAEMKWTLTTLFLWFTPWLPAQSVTLSWEASLSADVVGYRIYYGPSSQNYIGVTNAGLNLQQVVVLPQSGRWFFAATAVTANGSESDFSNEVAWEPKPVPPVLHGQAWVRLSPVIERSTNLVSWQRVVGESTWFCATNPMEFFATRQLLIERVQLVNQP